MAVVMLTDIAVPLVALLFVSSSNIALVVEVTVVAYIVVVALLLLLLLLLLFLIHLRFILRDVKLFVNVSIMMVIKSRDAVNWFFICM